MQTSTIMARALEVVKATLRSSLCEVGNILAIRRCIFESVIGRSGTSALPPSAASGGPTPMDVDAVTKGGAGTGKGV